MAESTSPCLTPNGRGNQVLKTVNRETGLWWHYNIYHQYLSKLTHYKKDLSWSNQRLSWNQEKRVIIYCSITLTTENMALESNVIWEYISNEKTWPWSFPKQNTETFYCNEEPSSCFPVIYLYYHDDKQSKHRIWNWQCLRYPRDIPWWRINKGAWWNIKECS